MPVSDSDWGDQQQLDGFLQAYAMAKAKLEARRHGHTVSEQLLQDGSIRLQILEGVCWPPHVGVSFDPPPVHHRPTQPSSASFSGHAAA